MYSVPHHSFPTPSRPHLGRSPSVSAGRFQVQPQASLLSVKMSPGSRGLFLFIFRFVPQRPSLCGAAPVLGTRPQNAILLRLPFQPPPGNSGLSTEELMLLSCGVGEDGGGHGNPLQYSCLSTIPCTEEPGGLQSMGLQRVKSCSILPKKQMHHRNWKPRAKNKQNTTTETSSLTSA